MTGERITIGPYIDQPYDPTPHYLDPKNGRLMCEIPFSEIKAGGYYQFEIMQAAAELSYLSTGGPKAIVFYEKFFRFEFVDLRSALIKSDFNLWPSHRVNSIAHDREMAEFWEYKNEFTELTASINMAWERGTNRSLKQIVDKISDSYSFRIAIYNYFLESPPAFMEELPEYPGRALHMASLNSFQSLQPVIPNSLTEQEQRVVNRLMKFPNQFLKYSKKDGEQGMAETLNLAPKTVRNYIANIITKWGANCPIKSGRSSAGYFPEN